MIHNNIKARREAAGIKQADLAREMRDAASASVLSGIESGRAMPTRTDMRTLCEAAHTVQDTASGAARQRCASGFRPRKSGS